MAEHSSDAAAPQGAEPDFLLPAALPEEHPKHVVRVAQLQRCPHAADWHFQYRGGVAEDAGFDHEDDPIALAFGTSAAKPPGGKYLVIARKGSSRLVAWWPTKVAITRLRTARARLRRRRCWRWPGGEREEGMKSARGRSRSAGAGWQRRTNGVPRRAGAAPTVGPAQQRANLMSPWW